MKAEADSHVVVSLLCVAPRAYEGTGDGLTRRDVARLSGLQASYVARGRPIPDDARDWAADLYRKMKLDEDGPEHRIESLYRSGT